MICKLIILKQILESKKYIFVFRLYFKKYYLIPNFGKIISISKESNDFIFLPPIIRDRVHRNENFVEIIPV
jgi:hypothetical protein